MLNYFELCKILGEVIDLSIDKKHAGKIPISLYRLKLSNLPDSHCVTFAHWLSSNQLVASSSQWATVAVFAEIIPKSDGSGDYSVEENFLRDLSPIQEIISGLIGSKEKPNIVSVSGPVFKKFQTHFLNYVLIFYHLLYSYRCSEL